MKAEEKRKIIHSPVSCGQRTNNGTCGNCKAWGRFCTIDRFPDFCPLEDYAQLSLKEIMPTDKEIEKWAKFINQTNFSYTFYDGLIWSAKWLKLEIEKHNK